MGPIGDILEKHFSEHRNATRETYNALEIAAGYGSHIMYNSQRFPQTRWIVTEKDIKCINSLNAHLNSVKPPRLNVMGPFTFDVSDDISSWPKQIKDLKGNFDLVLSVNMIHITEWKNVQALFAVASKVLKANSQGKLLTYGPCASQGVIAPQSNIDFDNYLKLSNSEWGIRDIGELEKEAS